MKTNDFSKWKEASDRLIPEVWPVCTPSFQIDKNERIFTIGSCFVRNMEEHLLLLGYQVPMLDYVSPKNEWPHRPNGILNKYTPADIYQELAWCEQIYLEGGRVTFKNIDKLLYAYNDDRVVDLHIAGFVPVTKARALERRQEIYDVFSKCFFSQTVIITLGMVEAWHDLKTELFILEKPSEEMLNNKQRFIFKRLNYRECYDYVQNSVFLIRKHCPDNKILITTSPVPLGETFTNEDIITANTYSKSVLRAVCGEIVDKNKNIDYFPAFETINLTKDWQVFADDIRHVSDKYVQKIVVRVSKLYFNP